MRRRPARLHQHHTQYHARHRRRVAPSAAAIVLALAVVLTGAATAGGATTGAGATSTPWPGGRWTPDPPKYGMVVETSAVTMSDGATLHLNVGYPADPTTHERVKGKFPVLLSQNPYISSTQPVEFYVSRGYIYVVSEVRGTGESTGPDGGPVANEIFSPRQAQDGVELVKYVSKKLSGSNGDIGLIGCSQLGIPQLFTAAKLGPKSPVKAMVPACASNGYYVYVSGGMPSAIGGLLGVGATAALSGPKNAVPGDAFLKQLGADIASGTGAALEQRLLADEVDRQPRRRRGAQRHSHAAVERVVHDGSAGSARVVRRAPEHLGGTAHVCPDEGRTADDRPLPDRLRQLDPREGPRPHHPARMVRHVAEGP